MNEQLSFDDLEKMLEKSKKFCTKVIFADGYAEMREYDEPRLNMWEDLIAKHGIIMDFQQIRGCLDDFEWQMPCNMYCSCAWGSLICFLKRGYMRHDGKWLRDDNKKIMISRQKECEWIPKENEDGNKQEDI